MKTGNLRYQGGASVEVLQIFISGPRIESKGGTPLPQPSSSTRSAALDRMTQALDAAKRARDRGVDVQVARRGLKDARAAFEAGNYAVAIERADYIIRLLDPGGAGTPPPMSGTSAVMLPETSNVESARTWIRQATGSLQEAKARGLNVHVAKAALTQAKKAFKAADYRAAVEFANQVVQLCASATLARR